LPKGQVYEIFKKSGKVAAEAKAEKLGISASRALERWYRILSQALKKFLRGRKLILPRQFQPAGAASYGWSAVSKPANSGI
jgi:hypothetical protein